MKISSKAKRSSTPHPQIVELINKLLNTPNQELSDILAQIEFWKWPRSDLNAWVKVLDKFDAILEDVIREYDVDQLQLQEFAPETKKMVSEVLRFERLLLENSTNRKMFNSYDRLKSLFMTSDLDVLILALNLLLRPAQQYSAQPTVSSALSISTPRLLSLAKKFPPLRDRNISLVDLTTARASPDLDESLADARNVHFSFYKTDSTSQAKSTMEVAEDPSLSSPQKQASPVSGAILIQVEEATLASKSVMEILAEAVEKYDVPEDEKLELLSRIRVAKALLPGHEEDREKLVIVRLLALAIFGHTHTETQATQSLFLHESDLTSQIAELLRVEHGVSVSVQTSTIAALDALVRYRGKTQEVFNALNAAVNHGILMTLLRKTVADVGEDESTLPHSFVDALLSFVSYVATNSGGGNMIVGAGLVPLLIQLMGNKLPNRLPVVSKTLQLIDSVVYNHNNAFQIFCNSNGIQILVDRIQYEIDLDIAQYGDEQRSREVFGSFGELPVARAAVLKHALRSMHRMMQSSGTAEALRGLIDSTLLQSIKKVILYRGLFGPSVIPLAINIMATFVHNEPSSLAVVQEAGLPEVFYEAIEAGLEPAIEVIQAFANAIGALCLNQTGQDQLRSRPSIIPSIFSIFTSDRHLKVLFDKENALLVGATIDELIRHHPLLKAAVFDSLKATLSKICDLGHNYVIPDDHLHQYILITPSSTPKAADTSSAMEGVETEGVPGTGAAGSSSETTSRGEPQNDDSQKGHDNQIISYIDVTCRFLEGLFQHPIHSKEFLDVGGLKYLTDLTALPCLPYDYATSPASDTLVQIMRTVSEAATVDTISHLAKQVHESLKQTPFFWKEIGEEARLASFIDLKEDQAAHANQQFRNLVILSIRVTLFSDVFTTAGFAHHRAADGLIASVMEEGSTELLETLGHLHRASAWENLLIQELVQQKGYNIEQPQSDLRPSAEKDIPVPSIIATGDLRSAGIVTEEDSQPTSEKKAKTHADHNAQAIRQLIYGFPNSVTQAFQALIKLYFTRRAAEPELRRQVVQASNAVAKIMLQHIQVLNVENKLHSYSYFMVMFGVLGIFLVDDRTSAQALQTVQLYAFVQAGGLPAMIKMCQVFIRNIEEIVSVDPERRADVRRQELAYAFGALTVALSFLNPVVGAGALFDAHQTQFLLTRDKPETDPDFFETCNFLVDCRLLVIPILKEIWGADWLLEAPISVVKTVVQIVFEVVLGENEDPLPDVPVPAPYVRQPATSAGPDENRIRQLTDMGFPRSAAETALAQTLNNVNAATELLLSNPFPYPPDPPAEEQAGQDEAAPAAEPEPEPEVEPVSDFVPPEVDEREGGDDDINMEEAGTTSRPPRKTTAELKKALADIRDPFVTTIAPRSLLLVDEHVSLIFDIHYAFVKPLGTKPAPLDAVQALVNDVRNFSPTACDVHEQPMANRCRLLALVLCENPSSLSPELRNSLMDSLLALLLANPLNTDVDDFNPPKWLAAHLLVVEALFALADEPPSITLPKEGEPISVSDPALGPTGSFATTYASARSIIFDFCLRLLAIAGLPSDETLSILRLLVLLTREYGVATTFVSRDGVRLLFERMRETPVTGCSSYVPIILRHTAEDPATLKGIMHHSVKHVLSVSTSRPRNVDPASFVKSCGPLALRDAPTFLDVVRDVCQLSPPYGQSQAITLKATSKPELPPSQAAQVVPPSNKPAMEVDSPANGATETLEAVVSYLISELMKAPKADAPESTTSQGPPTSTHGGEEQSSAGTSAVTADGVTAPTSDSVDEEKQNSGLSSVQFPIFIMECLTELLFSYDACKSAFLSYSPKKRTQTLSKESPSKYRMVTLNFCLSELITYGTISPQPSTTNKMRMTLCQWATFVIVALCVDSTSVIDSKEVPAELVAIRKFVLEALNRAIKDPVHSDTLDERYGRLFALVDLCYRLLTAQFSTSSRKPEESPTHIAKIMLEKNFVPTLTTALSEVDLNYPNVKNLVAAILKPLEHLTKVAIKMSRPSDKTKELEVNAESVYSGSSDDDDDDDEDEDEAGARGREETPDLYRNSALGMYGGEMESGNLGVSEDEMDEGDEDDDDIDMEYAGQETGSEHTSDSEEEEAELEDGEEDIEWEEDDEDEDDEEEDLVENEAIQEVLAEVGDDADDDEDDEDDDDEDEEGGGDDLWGGIIQASVAPPGDAREEGEEGPGEVDFAAIPIMRDNNGQEPEVMSEDDDFHEISDLMSGEPAAQLVQDIFGFGLQDGNRPGGGPLLVPRGHRPIENSEQLFARRSASSADAITHPLLMDSRSGVGRTPANTMRASRAMQRDFNPDAHNLMHAFEDLISTGAHRLFQQIASRSRGGATTFRLDMPAGVMNIDGSLPGPRNGYISTQLQIERPSRSAGGGSSDHQSLHFDPMMTLQRWGEENKILHGDFVQDRIEKLTNHLVLALLPDAVEAAKEAKLKEEAERKKKEEEAALKAKEEEVRKAKEEEAAVEKRDGVTEKPVNEGAENKEALRDEDQPMGDVERVPTGESSQPGPSRETEAAAVVPVPAPASSANTASAQGSTAAEVPADQPLPASSGDTDVVMADPTESSFPISGTVSAPGPADQPQDGPSTTAPAPERVTVIIHGSVVDITDTGIDPTFLEALPDDMREEVLNQHMRDRRATRVQRPADSQISDEFLDALPAELRAEIIQQEQLEQARRRPDNAPAAPGGETGEAAQSAGPEEMDPASFIASLDPHLRQVVLLDSDDGFIQTLPSHLLADSGIGQDGPHRFHAAHAGRRAFARRGGAPGARLGHVHSRPTATAAKPVTSHDAIQLLDKGGIAVLVRLLFFPPVLRKNLLFKVLLNICENNKTRIELFNLILGILQDGSTDLAGVDKSFAQMSFRQSKTQPSKSPGKHRPADQLGPSSIQSDAVPDLIAQRCLEALSYIVGSNESSSLFFLTEHELPSGLRRNTSKKGKGKEKQAPQSHFPIVLLLSLLDRQNLLKTPQIMESIVGLLAGVTRPLNSIITAREQKSTDQIAPSTSQVALPGGASSAAAPEPVPVAESTSNAPIAPSIDTSAPTGSMVTNPTSEPAPAAPEAGSSKEDAEPNINAEHKILLTNPPQIPHSALRLIVNILTTGECSARTFQQSLALIQNLSALQDARDVIAQELRVKAQEFGSILLEDLTELTQALEKSEKEVMAKAVRSKLSPASSVQAKLLRVLKTIDYMYSGKGSSATTTTTSAEDTEKVQTIYESFHFAPLWQSLSRCLTAIEEQADTEHNPAILLPLIEALMVVCKYISTASPSNKRSVVASPMSPTASSTHNTGDLFVTFTDAHRKVLNLMVRSNPSLMSGSFSLLVHNPRVLDFDNKRNYFRQKLHRRPHTREHHSNLQLSVRRARVFEDSYQHLQRKTADQIKFGKLNIRFYDEEGVDAGGVTREWFQILARQMFDPNNALFQPCAGDKLTYQPNKNSWVNPEHLSFFKFVGRVIGKAIYDGRLLDAYFARSLYRQILGKPVDYRDVEWIDPEYYNSLCWILENDPTPLDLTFSTEADEFGVTRIIPLKDDGESITVTQENKREFVQLSAHYRLYSSIKDQIEALLGGFYDVVPKDVITIFNEQELELLISGTPDIDVDEWRAATEYHGYNGSDPVIVWWWRALKSFNRDERAKVLSFATGTAKVPLGGFVDLQGVQGVQRFSIHRAYGEPDRLPQAHTCFNQIDLPEYSSYENLRRYVLLAINEGGEGFGFA